MVALMVFLIVAAVALLAVLLAVSALIKTWDIAERQSIERLQEDLRWSSGQRANTLGYAPDESLTRSQLQTVKQILLSAEMEKSTWQPRRKN
jgi:hypothetical protein